MLQRNEVRNDPNCARADIVRRTLDSVFGGSNDAFNEITRCPEISRRFAP